MIDLIKAKKYFKEYASSFDMNEIRINLKFIHMQKVAENAKKIAKNLDLSEEEQDLAELIGLLHDIGRFEQWKFYQTFSDKLSIDHGQKSVEVLFGDKLIRKFIQDDQYDNIIYKAINNHNKLEIEKGLSEKELLYAKIVRDADNIDIFRSVIETSPEDHTHYGSKNVSEEILSMEIFDEFKKEKPLLYSKTKNDMDIMVAIIAHIYAINFEISLSIIKENDYINKMVKQIDAKNIDTREKLNKIAENAMKYIERRIEK